jgi:hypothetical protein
MRAWKITCFADLTLLVTIVLAGCNHRPAINGEFNVSYAWVDGRLQTAVIETVKAQGPTSEAARNAIVETVQPYVADRVRAAALSRAAGRISVTIYGSPPYFVQIREFAITEPDFSALTVAVEKDDSEGIRKLISAYDNVNQRELPSRQTALAIAAAGGHVKSLRTLLELGADPNLSDYIGVTPLMNAVEAGSGDGVTALVRAGANIAAVNKAGDSATSLAKKLRRDNILPLLVVGQRSD